MQLQNMFVQFKFQPSSNNPPKTEMCFRNASNKTKISFH